MTASLTLKLKLTGMTRAAVRRKLGAWLIKLGALVIGCAVEIEVVGNGRPVVGS